MTIRVHWDTETPSQGYLFTFGAYGDTRVAILTDDKSLEGALEIAFEWLDDNAPGLLSRVDYDDAARELGIECESSEEDSERIKELSERDMTMCSHTTLKHGDCIPSWEWTFRGLTEAELSAAISLSRVGDAPVDFEASHEIRFPSAAPVPVWLAWPKGTGKVGALIQASEWRGDVLAAYSADLMTGAVYLNGERVAGAYAEPRE